MTLRAILLAFLVVGLCGQPAYAQELLSFTVTADPTKAKGSPWDGPPGLSKALIPIPKGSTAPDLAICIVEPGKPENCLLRRDGLRRPGSICQNAFTCQFDRVSVPAKPFGLIILDIDLQRHDLVDFVIVVPDGHPPQNDVEKLDIELHKHMDKLAPSVAESDYQRRQKDTRVLLIGQCSKPCRLTQSEIRIEKAK